MAAVFLSPPAAAMNEPEAPASALLLIAHGSRRAEANDDLEHLAGELRARGRYAFVQTAFLELARPTIAEGGAACVAAGAQRVVLLPYFLSPGVHARDDMIAARDDLAATFPVVEFLLAEPLGRHPLLAEIVAQRATEAEGK
jgi:sirohydrochlorin ferrochelatase